MFVLHVAEICGHLNLCLSCYILKVRTELTSLHSPFPPFLKFLDASGLENWEIADIAHVANRPGTWGCLINLALRHAKLKSSTKMARFLQK